MCAVYAELCIKKYAATSFYDAGAWSRRFDDPEAVKMGSCNYHVSGLTPTMGGDWLLHLRLKEGSKTATAVEFNLKAR